MNRPSDPHRDGRRRSGFTLIEMTITIWALGILLLIGTATLVGALKVETAASAAHRRLLQQAELADTFRADVAAASAAPASAGPVKAGATCLILQAGDGKQVVYRWEEGSLERTESVGAKSSHRRLPTGRATAVEFARSGSANRLVALRLTVPDLAPGVQRQREFLAALGGDDQ